MEVDYADIILILGSFEGTPDLLELSENRKYIFLPPNDKSGRWKGEQDEVDQTPPYLSVRFQQAPYAPFGWVLGSSDDDDCDYQLAHDSRATGVSKQFLRFDIDPKTKRPRLENLSRNNPLIVDAGNRVIDLGPGRKLNICQCVRIQIGTITFKAWEPIRTPAESVEYTTNAIQFMEEMLYSVPIPLSNTSVSQPETAALRVGERGVIYIERETVAKGTRGSVLKVQDTSSMKYLAAKEPYWRRSDTAGEAIERRQQLRLEHDRLVLLNHPNIIEALDFAESYVRTQPPWMIMPLIPDTLASFTLSEEHVPKILLQVSRALEYLHARNIAHRDLKPSNILIMKQGSDLTVKVADVGEARERSGNQKDMETCIGTSYFIAPEILDEKRAYTKAVDIWSFGIIILHSLLPNWAPQDDLNWNPLFAPSKEDHTLWISQQLRPTVKLVEADPTKAKYVMLLNGSLQEDAQKRWTAAQMREWLDSEAGQ